MGEWGLESIFHDCHLWHSASRSGGQGQSHPQLGPEGDRGSTPEPLTTAPPNISISGRYITCKDHNIDFSLLYQEGSPMQPPVGGGARSVSGAARSHAGRRGGRGRVSPVHTRPAPLYSSTGEDSAGDCVPHHTGLCGFPNRTRALHSSQGQVLHEWTLVLQISSTPEQVWQPDMQNGLSARVISLFCAQGPCVLKAVSSSWSLRRK